MQASPHLHRPNRMFKLSMLVFSVALHQTASITGSVCTILTYPLCLVTRCTTFLPSPQCPPSSEISFPCSSLASLPKHNVFRSRCLHLIKNHIHSINKTNLCIYRTSSCHERGNYALRCSGKHPGMATMQTWVPCPPLRSPAPRGQGLVGPEQCDSAALLGQPITLTPWHFSQAKRHSQLKAPFLTLALWQFPAATEGGAISRNHGGESCWPMNTAEAERCHLILVIWGPWCAALNAVRLWVGDTCLGLGCRTTSAVPQ